MGGLVYNTASSSQGWLRSSWRYKLATEKLSNRGHERCDAARSLSRSKVFIENLEVFKVFFKMALHQG